MSYTNEDAYDTSYANAILYALQFKPLYAMTVPYGVIQDRRRKNKVARAQRKVNRQNGSGK